MEHEVEQNRGMVEFFWTFVVLNLCSSNSQGAPIFVTYVLPYVILLEPT
jgi:uncharacterized protein YhhL (DUF1145 family)